MIDDIVNKYLSAFPEETESLQLLRSQIADGETLNIRSNFRGHATGAGVVLSPDNSKVLMIHHNALSKWMHPGGHMEPYETHPRDSARRESEEETGVQIAEQILVNGDADMPLDIAVHPIPARSDKGEPEHFHHDFRYVFRAASLGLSHQVEEVQAAEWVVLDDPRIKAMGRILAKLRQFKIINS